LSAVAWLVVADIRTYHARHGRMSPQRRAAVAALLIAHGLPEGPLDTPTLFAGRPCVLEIGFGLGDATVVMAQADPGTGIVAVDVHTPGVHRLLAAVDRLGLDNVRVVHGDAVSLLRERVAPDSLDGVRAFFPDPWPKARHHKRRLVRPDLVALIASRLRPGATLHVATDWAPYAEAMREVLAAQPLLEPAYDGGLAWGGRPRTPYEQAGRDAGRDVVDIVSRRREPGSVSRPRASTTT
jgi:tRNA (guanine-N7-)-methyltransferase